MSQDEIILHWQQGAHDSLEVAHMCLEAGKYEHALFNAHLAVEKALKARYIAEHNEAPLYTHELHKLATTLAVVFEQDDIDCLKEMSRLAVQARYADHHWSQQQATLPNATYWIEQAQYLLSIINPK